VQHQLLTVLALACQETRCLDAVAGFPAGNDLGGIAIAIGGYSHSTLRLNPALDLLGNMTYSEGHQRQTGWGITQGIHLGDTGQSGQLVAIHLGCSFLGGGRLGRGFHGYRSYRKLTGASVKRARSSLIIGEGVVTASFTLMVSVRRTASLNLNA